MCGVCGALYASLGQDYLGCRQARQGACHNARLVRRSHLEAHVLDVLGRQWMAPDLVAEFVTSFTAEWNQLIAEHATGGEAQRRELQAVERKISNLIDALSEGIRSADLQARLVSLESRQAILKGEISQAAVPLPPMPHDLADVYRSRVAKLRDALAGPDNAEAMQAARELVEQVVISPPQHDGDPPTIEVVGEFVAMLKAAGMGQATGKNNAQNTNLLRLLASSVKVDSGAWSHLYRASMFSLTEIMQRSSSWWREYAKKIE